MKKIGKALALLVMAAVLVFSVAACISEGKDDVNIVGTWGLTVDSSLTNYQEAEMYKSMVEAMNAVLEFKEDGVLIVSAKMGESENKLQGSWKYEKGTLTISDPTGATTAGAGSTTYTYKDGKFIPATGCICIIKK